MGASDEVYRDIWDGLSPSTTHLFFIHRVRWHPVHMVALIVGILLCVVLAVAVVGLVAIPARREGRDVLTPKGEEVVTRLRDRTGSAVDAVRVKSGGAMGAARDKVADGTSPQG
jgi:hypothetical protein